MESTEIQPITASASADNAFYLDKCACVEHRPAYAACVNKIERRQEGRLESIFSTCSNAINRGDCVAVSMREQEVLQGKAIYFVSRESLREAAQARDAGSNVIVASFGAAPTRKSSRGIAQPTRRAPETVSRPAEPFAMPSYADAINAAMRDMAAEPPAQPPIQAAMITMLPGESIREYAARARAAKEKATT